MCWRYNVFRKEKKLAEKASFELLESFNPKIDHVPMNTHDIYLSLITFY